MNNALSIGERGQCVAGYIKFTSRLIGFSMLHTGTNTVPTMYSGIRLCVYVIMLMKVLAGFTGLFGHP